MVGDNTPICKCGICGSVATEGVYYIPEGWEHGSFNGLSTTICGIGYVEDEQDKYFCSTDCVRCYIGSYFVHLVQRLYGYVNDYEDSRVIVHSRGGLN